MFRNISSNKSNIYEKDWYKFDRGNFILDCFSVDWEDLWKIDEISAYKSTKTFLDQINMLLTRWLPTTSILVVIERIYRYQFKSNYLKNHKFFATLNFQRSEKKKNEPHRSSISEVIDSERCAYLNA